MEKVNILIDCKWIGVNLKDFIGQVRLNKNIGKIYLVSTQENNVLQYQDEFDDCELIVYQIPFVLENLGIGGLTTLKNNIHGIKTTIKNIDYKYQFDFKMLDNMDTGIAFSSNNRFTRRFNYSLYSVEYGMDVYSFFINLFRDKNITFVYSITQSHYSSDYMLNKAAMDSQIVKNVVHKRCMGFANEGMHRFCLIDTKSKEIYKVLPDFHNGSVKESRMYKDAGFEDREKTKLKYVSSLLFDTTRVFNKLTFTQSLRVLRKKIYDNLYFYPFYLSKLAEYYESVCISPDFDEKYILVSLHFEPESTISPTDGINSLQLYNLKILRSILPSGWKIYVKEHPTQFKKVAYQALDSFIRSLPQYKNKRFYEYISQIPDVKVISIKENQKKLIESAQIVVSNAGSVFVEASSNDKPCLCFGNLAFAAMFNNVWHVSDIENCRLALKEILNKKQIKSDYKEVLENYSMQMKVNESWLSPTVSLLNQLYPY